MQREKLNELQPLKDNPFRKPHILRTIRYIGYWTNDRSTSEVDFVYQDHVKIIPVEVKTAENLKAKSFKLFCEKYQPETAIRTSLLRYQKESWMVNIPLYALE
jgi:uncharacterized protein